jgi:cell wall-associated NlpC family hydrolase
MITGGAYRKDARRERVVRVAQGWLGTPYHPGGRVKGAGVDCLTLLAEVYHEAGIVPHVDVPYYPHDWHLHRGTERYLDGLLTYAKEIADGPRMGDIALWKFGRCYSHGAIVVEWPLVIHAYVGRACVMENVECAGWLSMMGDGLTPRPVKLFDAVGE